MVEATTLVSGLKIDLGITTNAYDDRLLVYLQNAQARLTEEGITLSDSISDGLLTQQYAGWMWRKRDSGEGMPRMLRWQINNRLFSEKMQ